MFSFFHQLHILELLGLRMVSSNLLNPSHCEPFLLRTTLALRRNFIFISSKSPLSHRVQVNEFVQHMLGEFMSSSGNLQTLTSLLVVVETV